MADLQLDTLEARGLICVHRSNPNSNTCSVTPCCRTRRTSRCSSKKARPAPGCGVALEDLYPERVGELAAVLALHFEQAGDSDKAVHYLYEAASFALDATPSSRRTTCFARGGAPCQSAPRRAYELRAMRIEIQLGRAEPASPSSLRMRAWP